MSSLQTRTQQLWTERHPGLDTSPMAIVALVNRISAVLDRAVEHLYDNATLTQAEARLLIPLRHLDEPVTAAYLAAQLGMSRAGISKTLAKLERRGFIIRSTNPADRRVALIAMTPAAEDAIDDIFPRELTAHARLLAGLDDERSAVLAAMTRLVEVMELRSAR